MAHREHHMHLPRSVTAWRKHRTESSTASNQSVDQASPIVEIPTAPERSSGISIALRSLILLTTLGAAVASSDGSAPQMSGAEATAVNYGNTIKGPEPVRLPTAGPVEVPFIGTPTSGDLRIGQNLQLPRRAS